MIAAFPSLRAEFLAALKESLGQPRMFVGRTGPQRFLGVDTAMDCAVAYTIDRLLDLEALKFPNATGLLVQCDVGASFKYVCKQQ